MADTLPLDFVPSSPSGPSGGRLQIEAGRVAVVRKGVFGTKAALERSRNDLRGYERGTASELAGRGWMSAGAQLALQRAAMVDPARPYLAIRFDDPVGLGDVWLFTGPTDAMDLAISALSSGGVPSAAGAVVGSGARGVTAPGPGGTLGVPPAMDAEVDRIREAFRQQRRPRVVARFGTLLLVLAILGVVGWTSDGWIPGFIGDVKDAFEQPRPVVAPPELPMVPGLPPGNPPEQEGVGRPISVRQALRGIGSPRVEEAGVTQAGRQRRTGRAVIIPLRYRNRAVQLVVFPDPGAARDAKRATDQLFANLLLRGPGSARAAPVVFASAANPRTPVI